MLFPHTVSYTHLDVYKRQDEYLDLENQRRFLRLKGALLPEIEIVQMNYITPPDFNTVQNCKKEPRPKLFKRLRTFSWVDPVHETIRTDPVIYDSDIDILHRPHVMHAKRDFAMFEKAFRENRVLSEKITRMYARELYKCGDEEDFLRATDYFSLHYEAHADAESACILAHAAQMCIRDRPEGIYDVQNGQCWEIKQKNAYLYEKAGKYYLCLLYTSIIYIVKIIKCNYNEGEVGWQTRNVSTKS